MTKRITDRDMLVRTMHVLEATEQCCDFFACPGKGKRPVPMASCAEATAAYELRAYLKRNGGWCPEHGQNLGQCVTPCAGPHTYTVCRCAASAT